VVTASTLLGGELAIGCRRIKVLRLGV
jgi:hypothetical protein